MSFEKDFPEFKEYSISGDWSDLINWDSECRGYDKEEIKEAIQEHCISKSKVKEAIKGRIEHFKDWKKNEAGDNKQELFKCHVAITILEELLTGLDL